MSKKTSIATGISLAILAAMLVPDGPLASRSPAQEAEAKPKGYVAEITDSSGLKMTVYGISFGYTYRYTQSNCMWNCGAYAESTLTALPLNEGCGTTIIPFSRIQSITDISQVKSMVLGVHYETFRASITFTDGKVLKTAFGSFSGQSVHMLKGQSAFGKYSLGLNKTKQIVFQHEKDILPLPKEEWGNTETKVNATVVCPNGMSHSLSTARLYSVGREGKTNEWLPSFNVRMGESLIYINLDRLKVLANNPTPDKKNKFTLTTITGDAIEVLIESEEYLGGYSNGNFFYVRLKDIKGLSIER